MNTNHFFIKFVRGLLTIILFPFGLLFLGGMYFVCFLYLMGCKGWSIFLEFWRSMTDLSYYPLGLGSFGARLGYQDQAQKALAAGDYSKAIDAWKECARLSDRNAMYQLGECFEWGRGCIPDMDEALKWYQLALQYKHPEAKQAVKRISVMLKYREIMW